ncbi:MAG: uvrA 1, partial [Planctomycetaceae bacterium]|nr:uvrA 1 [Planctomycetaceae bacterium]
SGGTKKTAKKSVVSNQPLQRSYTGEMLESILAKGIRSEREIFDRKAVSKKREGDVELKQVGESAKMPWETDGRAWHLEQRIGHNGKPGRWETQSLIDVIDVLEQSESFAPTNWNSRSIVEVAAKKGADGWFLHALTGDEWLLKLNFHVPRNTFQQQALTEQLNLTPLDDLDEIQVYGRGPRVQAVNRAGPWQEVSITLHWHKEMNTPGFRKFLKDAQAAFLKTTSDAGGSIEDKMPWKVLGKKWHLSRKGFPTAQRVAWDPAVLERLVEMLEAGCPGSAVDWTGKQTVTVTPPTAETAWATITTKRKAGLDLVLATPPGRFALGRIAAFGAEREIVANKKGVESIQIRFDELNQLNTDLQSFLNEHAQQVGKERKLF